jgi:signal transduction histidine kinase
MNPILRLFSLLLPGAVLAGKMYGQETASNGEASADSVPVITSIAEIAAASPANRTAAYRKVRVEGVVTASGGSLGPWLTVHDGQSGCAVDVRGVTAVPPPGQRIDVTGELAAETHFCYVSRPVIRSIGAAPLPAALRASAPQLASGRDHAGFVSLQAAVLDVCREEGRLIYLLGSGTTSFNAFVDEPAPGLPLEQLNGMVEIRGVSWSFGGGMSGKPTSFRLHLLRQDGITVVSPGASDLWGRPRCTLKQYAEARPGDDRYVIAAMVTHTSPGGELIVDDGTEQGYVSLMNPLPRENLRAEYVPRVHPRPQFRPGDRVDIVCSKLRERGYSPALDWAEVRITGHGTVPPPPLVTMDDLLSGDTDCRPVRIQGRVIDYDFLPAGRNQLSRLLFTAGGRTGYVTWTGMERAPFEALPGASVEVTGVPLIIPGNVQAMRGFTILLSDPAAVRVLPPLPLWRNPLALQITGGVLAVVLLAGTWILLLRRQVAARTAELRTSYERLRRSELELQDALLHEQEIGRMKSNFVSVVSHEFRTPLGVIVSSADILRRYFDRLQTPDRAGQLDAILRSSRTLGNLIEDLLLLGKVEAGKLACQPAELDPASLCRHLADEVLSATHRTSPVHVTASGDFTGAMGDESLLRPALTNILSNAVKYSDPGSPVEFELSRDGPHAVFVIRDSGIGIPEADRGRLFDVFARGSNVGTRPGTGLGLVIARRCIELHGGRISFQSRAGGGTEFTVVIPLWPEPVPDISAPLPIPS